ncbi:hypothetical protein PR202_gb06941 [Eleusine coracana subsp. coracana]|uniref:Protein kish n=1 Tax=Eleusine coracana subsp. coracana TaxID=191504 RepID=A0AAV5EBP3_ELECO|nr:hypothetical protein PR202_gb06941 [Eleusine coracana subsp. coracana]
MQSALFNFHSFVTVVLLLICTCTYLKMHFPSLLVKRTGCVFSLRIFCSSDSFRVILCLFLIGAVLFIGFVVSSGRLLG